MERTTVAVDLAKSVFQIAVSRRPGKTAETRRLGRRQLPAFFAQYPSSTVVMEACGTSSFWGRKFESMGHEVVLLPPSQVRPYVRRNKTDSADAKALLEAHRNEAIRPVPIKSVSQQILAALHRFRAGWMAERTARINGLRGVLRELGVVIPVGAPRVVPAVTILVQEADSEVPDGLRQTLWEVCREIRDLERRIKDVEKQLEALGRQCPAYARLRTIPGVGLLTATALLAFVGDVRRFPTGRHFASYLGLTPKEHSSGLTRHLGGISKRGDTYLRMLLVHGARSVLFASRRHDKPERLRAWAMEVEKRSRFNKAAVALANKLARIIWAVWRQDDAIYTSRPKAA
jgi:transposase